MEQMTALRAEWFAQLAEAIESAQRVAWQLRTQEGASLEARELYSRLESARLELESLRKRGVRGAVHPDFDWLKELGWSDNVGDPPD